MDALLLDLQKVSEQLLPIIGAVALIFVCILLKRAAEFVEELTKTVKDLKPTIQKVDESMEKIQGPLDTAVKLCKTVDNVHEKTTTSMDKLSDLFAEYFEKIKAFVMDMFGSFNNDTMGHPSNHSVKSYKAANYLSSHQDLGPLSLHTSPALRQRFPVSPWMVSDLGSLLICSWL